MKKSIVFIGIIFLMLLGTTVALAAAEEVVVKATVENNRIYVGDKTKVGFTAVFTDPGNPVRSITLDSDNFADNGVINFNFDCFAVSYSSDNSDIAAVDDKGVVTGISAGTAKITQRITFNLKDYDPGPLINEYYTKYARGCDEEGSIYNEFYNHAHDTFTREVTITVVPDDRLYLCQLGKEPVPVKMMMNTASVEIDRLCVGATTNVDFSATFTDLNDPTVKYTFSNSNDASLRLDPMSLFIRYSSDNNGVAFVDYSGKVTGISEGWANITVKLNFVLGDYSLTMPRTKNIARLATAPGSKYTLLELTRRVSILVHPAPVMNNVILAQSESRQLTVAAPPGFDKGLLGFECGTWLSGDPSIAKVNSEYGTITGLRPGRTYAVYFLKTSSERDFHTPIVSSVTVYPVMAIHPESINVYIGTPKTLKVTFDSWYSGEKTGTWSVADETVASIDQSGKVTGKKPGTTTATFTIIATGAQTDCTVVVAETPFRIAPNPLGIYNGDTEKLAVTFDSGFTGEKTGTWSVADGTIASVEDNSPAPRYISRRHIIPGTIGAKVTGLKPGATTVTYTNTATGAHQDCTVTVKPAFKISPDPLTVYTGETGSLAVAFDDGYTGSRYGKWSVDDNTVASIDQNGVVTGKKAGTAIAAYAVDPTHAANETAARVTSAYNIVRTVSVVVKPGTFTVTFDPNGGGLVPESVTVKHDATVIRPGDPSLSGMRFLGWYTALNGGSKWDFANDKVMGDMTLYAHWDVITMSSKSSARSPAYTAPTITGPDTINLLEGYDSIDQAYTFGGSPAPTYGISPTGPNTANAAFAGTTLTIPEGLGAGSYEVTLFATNSVGTATKTVTVNVSPAGTLPTITGPDTINLLEGYDSIDQAYTFGGSPAPTYGISPTEPNTANAAFAGTTLTIPEGLGAGSYEVTLFATNSVGTATKTVTVYVYPVITINFVTEIEIFLSREDNRIDASGGAGGPYTFDLASGAMPDGLTLNSDGTITNDGTATIGVYPPVTVTVTDRLGNSITTTGLAVRVSN